jgi:integrase
LDYRRDIQQVAPGSLRNRKIELRHLIDWAGDTPLSQANEIAPIFPVYLLTARRDQIPQPLAPATLMKTCAAARMFFVWAKQHYPDIYGTIPDFWIQTIRPRRSSGMQTKLKKRVVWELEEVLQIARLPVDNMRDRRDQAAICFLYLSGMRAAAFVTLPAVCVDIALRRVEQLPEKGVATKGSKAAVTTLLPIPDLLSVVERWDEYIRSALPVDRYSDAMWYPRLGPDPHHETIISGWGHLTGRRQSIIRGLIHFCRELGIPYKSPHKLRHGHALYGVKHSKTMAQLKAVSQNLMHSTIAITDGVYGNLPEEDIRSTIATLNEPSEKPPATVDLSSLAQALVILQANPALLQALLSGKLSTMVPFP